MKSFPQPFLPLEESRLLCRMKEGDSLARNLLIEHNLRLVAHIAKKYNNGSFETDDLISIGTIGLIKAIDTFDEKKGIRLATYASRCIENELLMLLRNSRYRTHEVYLYDSIGADKEGNAIRFMDICEAEEIDVVERLEHASCLKRLLFLFGKCLTNREQSILIKRFGLFGEKEMTQLLIAKEFKISRSYVSRIEKKALQKLRKAYLESCINAGQSVHPW